jgi:ribosomal protein S18 acetylase RimI-like enzyme
MPADCPAITLRPEGRVDEAFLLELYAGTREDERVAMGWPDGTWKAFVGMQFNAQQKGYRAVFPNAEFSIILTGDQTIGRMIVNRAEDEIRLVDLAVLPGRRGRGIGTALIQNLLREAAASGKPARLSAIKGQRALQLYQRLGFRKTGEDSMRDRMEWRGGK